MIASTDDDLPEEKLELVRVARGQQTQMLELQRVAGKQQEIIARQERRIAGLERQIDELRRQEAPLRCAFPRLARHLRR
jgi:hypothetical protein